MPWGCVIENQAVGPVDVGLLGAVGIVLALESPFDDGWDFRWTPQCIVGR